MRHPLMYRQVPKIIPIQLMKIYISKSYESYDKHGFGFDVLIIIHVTSELRFKKKKKKKAFQILEIIKIMFYNEKRTF